MIDQIGIMGVALFSVVGLGVMGIIGHGLLGALRKKPNRSGKVDPFANRQFIKDMRQNEMFGNAYECIVLEPAESVGITRALLVGEFEKFDQLSVTSGKLGASRVSERLPQRASPDGLKPQISEDQALLFHICYQDRDGQVEEVADEAPLGRIFLILNLEDVHEPLKAFDLMVRFAVTLHRSAELSLELLDEQGAKLSQQSISHMQDKVRNFQLKQGGSGQRVG